MDLLGQNIHQDRINFIILFIHFIENFDIAILIQSKAFHFIFYKL